MRRIILASMLATFLATPFSAIAGQRSKQERLIPAGEVLWTGALQTIGTKSHRKGDILLLDLLEDVFVDGRLALPRGSLVEAEVTRSRRGGRLFRRSRFAFEIRRVILADGRRLAVKASPLKLKGGTTFGRKAVTFMVAGVAGPAGPIIGVVGVAARGPDIVIPPQDRIPFRLTADAVIAPGGTARSVSDVPRQPKPSGLVTPPPPPR